MRTTRFFGRCARAAAILFADELVRP
jgi:hypothetical protein